MEDYIDLGLGDGKKKVTSIGIGTWKIPNDSDSGMKAIRYGLGLGINMIDTAEMYGNEELVGKAIKGFDNVNIATKVSPSHFNHDDLKKSCKESLRKLGVESIWLYQLHWPNNRVPISETMHAMEELLDEGKIKNIGVSNFSIDELLKAQEALDHSKIVSNQVEYSIVMREPDPEMLEFCNNESIALIAYSPLARGAIANDKRLIAALSDISKKYSKTIMQISLRYLLQKGNVIAIPKASSEAHIKENFHTMGWKLSQEDMDALDSLKGFKKPPLAGKMLRAFLKNTSIWAKLMESNEKKRKEIHQ